MKMKAKVLIMAKIGLEKQTAQIELKKAPKSLTLYVEFLLFFDCKMQNF